MFDFLTSANNTAANDSISSSVSEIGAIKAVTVDDFINRMVNGAVEFAIHLAIAFVVFYVGRFVINKLYSVVSSILIRRKVDKSLTTFVLSLIKIVLYFILIVTVIGILGIETSSFIAIFASAGVAVGMALSGTLQNFAGGVLILLLKPYKVGDYIEAQGYSGTVTEIQIFHTIVNTADNKSIIIPNGGLSTGSINNFSREDYRRVDWSVGISYGDNVDVARKAILDILDSDNRVVKQYIETDREERLEEEVEKEVQTTTAPEPEVKRSLFYRLTHHRHKVKSKIEEWHELQAARIKAALPKVDRSPVVYVSELADSSVNLTCRAWVRSGDYWAVYFAVNERIYKELPQHGINFPFPHMDVYLSGAGNPEVQ